jgi:hypothetical protein
VALAPLPQGRSDGTIADRPRWNVTNEATDLRRIVMGFGRGALLWLLGVPLPIILLLALFWHN